MADIRPTPVSFFSAIRMCVLLLFTPRRFIDVQNKDAKARNDHSTSVEREHGAYIVRRAFIYSLLLVLLSGGIGFGMGLALGTMIGCPAPKLVSWLQIAGAGLLLWGTLFVRGWEIETFCGVTFTERVNQWLYRALYCGGTAVVVCSLSWPLCTT